MDNTLNLNISLTIGELATILHNQLSKNERYKLTEMLQRDDTPTKHQLKTEISQAVKELNLVKQGKLKTCPIADLLNEL